MGFADMLGIKSIKITTKESLDLNGLFEKIKDAKFDAGVPELVKHGGAYVIAFPPEDRENQVWILANKGGFVVQRSVVVAGLSNMVSNSIKAGVLNELSGGVTGAVSAFGGPKKACMAHCDNVAEVINAMNL